MRALVFVIGFFVFSQAFGQDVQNGAKLYKQYCASCHGEKGKGDGPAAVGLNPKPRDHTDPKYMSTLSDERMFKVIKEGGASVGLSPAMAPWGGVLKDKDIKDVIAFIRKDLCKCEYVGGQQQGGQQPKQPKQKK